MPNGQSPRDFHIPQEHHIEVNQEPSTAQELTVSHELSDDQVRAAMGTAAGMLGEIQHAEATGALDTALPPTAPEAPSVADQVAELDARDRAKQVTKQDSIARVPDMSDEDIWNEMTSTEGSKE